MYMCMYVYAWLRGRLTTVSSGLAAWQAYVYMFTYLHMCMHTVYNPLCIYAHACKCSNDAYLTDCVPALCDHVTLHVGVCMHMYV